MFRFLLLLIIIPITEFYLIVQTASQIGFWNTIGLIILTGITGILLLRLEGFTLLVRLQKELVEGRMPQHSLSRSFLTFAGGLLLLIPGFLTDIAGLIMILPFTRIFLIKAFEHSMRHMMNSQHIHFYYRSPTSPKPDTQKPSSNVIDVVPESVEEIEESDC